MKVHDNVICFSRTEPETDSFGVLGNKVRGDGVLRAKLAIDLIECWRDVLHLQYIEIVGQLSSRKHQY